MTGIDGYGVPARNDIAANAMMFPEMSLPPRCRPFLTKRRQRGGCHYASSKDLYPASSVIPQHYPLQRTRRRRSAQGNACPDSGKTRHRKPFLGFKCNAKVQICTLKTKSKTPHHYLLFQLGVIY